MAERVRVKFRHSRPRAQSLRDLPDAVPLHPGCGDLAALRLVAQQTTRSSPTGTVDGERRPPGRVSPKGVNWVLQWAIEGESNILSRAGVQAWTG
jgi:hypothetical protein